ncbi:amino-acid N-acetyltransferas-like protein subunit Mak10 [Lentithecium fluviatile CBS 122367]|uniref:Amino-acid N-acetyltransferas-like protein subunit Mak10 n=1 Tax=Lentithecium fluviatile CBS 122367 TaxID=1168545 RepID=A0A6G1JFA3_9PLEO|nr:amino-acid N-acetyltransferas-like protein subunit Mak10 [Lentithecium fluviatile CBS 122367]
MDVASSSANSSRVHNDGSVYAPISLPLRQAFKQHVAKTNIHNITEKFTKACNGLDVGQLVKDEYFTLFESIGALEIMDPKMDSGFLQPGETLEDDYDPLTPLLPDELIGIMDQLLCYEMAWHTGYPLSQTLFTSLHIDRLLWPETKVFEHAQFYRGDVEEGKRPGVFLEVLRAYCLALVKGCDFVIAKVTGRDYFEEEDFCTNTYNRVLFVQVPVDVFARELDAAVDLMEDPDLDIPDALRKAITTRLDFRKSFLTALDLDLPLDNLSRYWAPILSSITTIKNTHALGTPVPSSFSTKIQRKLASTVPPRPIVDLAFADALAKLTQLCTDCEEATRFTTLPLDPLEYQAFLWTFASRDPTPLPYSRSYLSTILFDPATLNTSISLPLTDIRSLVFPSSPILDPLNWTLSPPRNPLLPKPPRLQLALLIDDFVDRAGQPYLDFWIALGQNRCRLRRMLTHVIIAWDFLQVDAALVDADLMATCQQLGVEPQVLDNPLTAWVYVKKLWMMEKVVLLGFEQDIYLPDEFAGMYYFLSVVAAKRAAELDRCEKHVGERTMQLIGASRYQDAQDVDDMGPYVDSELQQAKGVSEFAKALYRFYTILLYLGLIPHLKRPFSTEELRYELRMKPFLALQPVEVPLFAEFQAALQPYGSYSSPSSSASLQADLRDPDSALWTSIDAAIKAAKDAFARVKKYGSRKSKASGVEQAWGKEVNGLLASCVALGVGVAGVKDAVGKAEGDADSGTGALGVKVEIPKVGEGKRYAEGWVVGKVVKV